MIGPKIVLLQPVKVPAPDAYAAVPSAASVNELVVSVQAHDCLVLVVWKTGWLPASL